MTRWDETGHTTCPAACFVPVESEPHAGGEVGRDWTHNMPCGMFCACRIRAACRRRGGARLDTQHALRHFLCLSNLGVICGVRCFAFTNRSRTLERYRFERHIGDVGTRNRHVFWHSAGGTNPGNRHDGGIFHIGRPDGELLAL